MALYLGTNKVSSGLYTKGRGVLDEYSEAEIKTNKVWKNGKPIYRKVWNNLTLPSLDGSWKHLVDYPSSEVEDVTDLRAILVGGDGRKITIPYYESNMYYLGISYQPPANDIQLVGKMSGFIANRVICIMEYTKPQDEVASGYIPDNLPRQLDNYSTEEQIVGKWIDGKPIYRKTYIINVPNQTARVDTNISDLSLENVWLKDNSFLKTNANNFKPLNVYESSSYFIRTELDNTAIKIIPTANNYYSGTAYVTIEYTKTTD